MNAIIRSSCLAAFCATLAIAGTVTFTALPDPGLFGLQPLATSGWGYSIQNSTGDFVVPLGISNSGVLFGSLSDIFDYPVVGPGQTAFQAYSFNAPGGFGASLGLFEYTMPAEAPAGLDQSGVFSFSYQLYSANPDLDPNASPVGSLETQTGAFDVSAAVETSVPEPSTFLTLAGAIGVLLLGLLRRQRCA